MKKLVLFFAMTILTSVMSFAQLAEGMISYDIEMSSDDPEAASMIAMFSGSNMNLYFANDVARTELNFGALMSMTTVVNNETEEVLILMGGMMGNKAVLTNSTEMEVDEEDAPETTVTLSKEKKEILGYKCKKAIITDQDGNEMEYWYTDKIATVSTDKNSAISKLPGMPLEYSVDRDGMIMTFTASAVKESLDAETIKEKLSLTIPDDYEEMTYEEFSDFGGGE